LYLRAFLVASCCVGPSASLAVGFNDDDTPPQPTATTTECPEGTVYDETAEGCVVIEESNLTDDVLYDATRELAYAGRLTDALATLSMMTDLSDSRVQTYFGFIYRQLGEHNRAMAHYAAALQADPDNMLARSYLGMAHVAGGRLDLARAELQQIRARGAAGSWPDRALARAIRTGIMVNY